MPKVGSVLTDKSDSNKTYIKVDRGFRVNSGDTISVKSRKDLLQDIEYFLSTGVIDEATASKRRSQVEKMPSFVKFEIHVGKTVEVDPIQKS